MSFPVLKNDLPEAVAMNPAELDTLDTALVSCTGLRPGSRSPGAVVLIARRAIIVKFAAYGFAQTHKGKQELDEPRPIRTDTIFDLASITKVASTTAACMRLADEGRLVLDAPVSTWRPEFSGKGKERVTARYLLAHRSGLWEWQPLYLDTDRREGAIRRIAQLDLRYPVGQGRHYSDLGFMLLGEMICRITGEPLDSYVTRAVHRPLGMADTCYRPANMLRDRVAATSLGNPFEQQMISMGDPYPVNRDPSEFGGWRGHTLVGEANDGNAYYCFAGVAGHAGLFSTAYDLAIFGQTLLNGGGYGATRLCSEAIVREFTSEYHDRGQGLGFRTRLLSAIAGNSAAGFGHSGFTGTQLFVDPQRDLLVVLLTNRQHPDLPYASIEPIWQTVLRCVIAAVDP
jgi:CubicO group peptidase (beta-lactamase class C family)